MQWAGLQAAVAILSLTGWLENKHFRKGQSEYFLANICFHTQLNGQSVTKPGTTNSCQPESSLISSHAALPVNSYGILLGREINRKWKRREERRLSLCGGGGVEDVLQPGKLCVCMTQSALAQMVLLTRWRGEQGRFCLGKKPLGMTSKLF